MHEYHSQFLAHDRQRQLHAEAHHVRLTKEGKRSIAPAAADTPHRPFRLSFGRLLRRAA